MKSFSDIAGRRMVHLGDDYDRRLAFATRATRAPMRPRDGIEDAA